MCCVCCFNLWGVSSGNLFLAWHVFTLPQAFIHSCSQKMFPVHQLQPSSTNAHTIYIYIYCAAIFSSNNTCSNILQNCVSILNVFSRLHWTWTLKRSAFKSLFPCSWLKTFSAKKAILQYANEECRSKNMQQMKSGRGHLYNVHCDHRLMMKGPA